MPPTGFRKPGYLAGIHLKMKPYIYAILILS